MKRWKLVVRGTRVADLTASHDALLRPSTRRSEMNQIQYPRCAHS